MEHQLNNYKDIERILITKEEIAQKVALMGEKITQDYQGKELVIVCILKGAVMFFSDLARHIDLPLSMDFMVVSSYGASTKSSGIVRIVKDLDRSIENKHVLVIEDIVDSGMTLHYLTDVLKQRNAASVSVVTLLDKPSRRRVPFEVEYSCFNVPDAFVVGYGLDYDEKYRNLPDICVLDPKIYTDVE